MIIENINILDCKVYILKEFEEVKLFVWSKLKCDYVCYYTPLEISPPTFQEHILSVDIIFLEAVQFEIPCHKKKHK